MKRDIPSSLGLLVLRLIAGGILAYAGAQKAFGVFGGMGLDATIKAFEGMGFPSIATYCAIAGELLGGLGIMFGALTRIAAAGAAVTLIVATLKVYQTTPNTDPMWMMKVGFPALVAASAICIGLTGAGSVAIDSAFKLKRK